MKKCKHIVLYSTATLALSSLAFASTAVADNSDMKTQRVAASVVQFLSNAMYPDSSSLGAGEENLLKSSKKADQIAASSNNDLVLSSLSSAASASNAAVVTAKGIKLSQTHKSAAKTYSHDNMASFLCGSQTSKCLYTPGHRNALMQTLMGNPYASGKGGLTASDTLLTPTEADASKNQYSYNSEGSSTEMKFAGSFDKSSYFNYNKVFGDHEPDSLEPAKYYGMFVTDAYDVNQLSKQPKLATLISTAMNSGNVYKLRNNPTYQQYILLTRKLTAINSALMGNILWLAKQHTVNVPKESSPTKEAMSQAQADNYIGNHRLNDDGEWVNKIKNESPTELLREQTLMMAEANHQREESNQTLKRVLATVTIIAAENKKLYTISADIQSKVNASK